MSSHPNVKKYRPEKRVFDYRGLRLMVGLIALGLPYIVTLIAKHDMPSISHYYYDDKARNLFVGLLFIVAAFMWAYNGNPKKKIERVASNVGAIAALLVALFPTSPLNCDASNTEQIHYIGAAVLFSVLTYFCFFPFQRNTFRQGGRKTARSCIYIACGLVMITSMVMIALSVGAETCNIAISPADRDRTLFLWEFIALQAFGVSWIVAGKFPGIADSHESYNPFAWIDD